jgi:hypothetical protein
MKTTILLSLIILISITCKQKVEPIAAPIYAIEKQFQPFMNSFLKEAAERNIRIDTTNLIIKLNDQLKVDKCGTCTYSAKNKNSQKIVEIYTNVLTCWPVATYNAKEALIFHELGHCLLGRIDHKNDTFADGSPKSIMVANNQELYSPCVYVIDDNPVACNKTIRRKYYIDELFDVNAPKPAWAE